MKEATKRQLEQFAEQLERAEKHIAKAEQRKKRNAGLLFVGLLIWPLALPVDGPLIRNPWFAYPLIATYFFTWLRQLAVSMGYGDGENYRRRSPTRPHHVD